MKSSSIGTRITSESRARTRRVYCHVTLSRGWLLNATRHAGTVVLTAFTIFISSIMAPRPHFDLESLSTSIPAIFDQAQISAATHRKNCVALYKLQVASADVVESMTRGRDAEVKLVGERAFSEIFLGMLNRVLIVKKSTPAADRIVKFVAAYVEFLNEKGVYTPYMCA